MLRDGGKKTRLQTLKKLALAGFRQVKDWDKVFVDLVGERRARIVRKKII
jgi:Mn-dependent DtxR family transcriptional regulator